MRKEASYIVIRTYSFKTGLNSASNSKSQCRQDDGLSHSSGAPQPKNEAVSCLGHNAKYILIMDGQSGKTAG
jgi:hypothetical protein